MRVIQRRKRTYKNSQNEGVRRHGESVLEETGDNTVHGSGADISLEILSSTFIKPKLSTVLFPGQDLFPCHCSLLQLPSLLPRFQAEQDGCHSQCKLSPYPHRLTPSLGMKWEALRKVFWWSLGYLAPYLLGFYHPCQ